MRALAPGRSTGKCGPATVPAPARNRARGAARSLYSSSGHPCRAVRRSYLGADTP
jgi:hypothetical protein